MFYWSRYNFCFRSSKYGVLLYNAISNSFSKIPEENGEFFLSLKSGDEVPSCDAGMYLQLITLKCLVTAGEDDKLRDIVRMKRRLKESRETALNLTIAPTRGCNFACVYCFEQDRRPLHMNEETEEALLEFIRRFKSAKALNVTWFGGEPLLRFKQIARLTAKFKEMGFEHYYANIITNGYLLTDEVAQRLYGLDIKELQITIDGPEEIHDSRRKLLSGKGTYQKIMENIGRLQTHRYPGRVNIRVNTDMSNAEHFHLMTKRLEEQFPDLKLNVYPGIVHDNEGADHSCLFNTDETVNFYINQYKQYGIQAVNFFPSKKLSSCVAVCRNAYVVGPEGELYKCWEDIGKAEKIVGSIFPGKKWNPELLGQWMEGQNALNDKECLECNMFPICNGGCPFNRMQHIYEGKNNIHCSHLKNHLAEFLELHYEKRYGDKD